ncbi:MAG: bifunctional adenosylcobinamide kinase/adenosylcobinamide-phosphate guanylyltransferase [Proteobacteria bacterium]|nr:bifunctional adenosylcobinamide kinase/adenosylcobinamide-phosphate guanylyltransferase [Pseudomonadota bacterium]
MLGGARSGKSAYAEGLVEAAAETGSAPVYLATAEAGDAEMTARIARHRERRGGRWRTEEAPLDLAAALTAESARAAPVLVDCLTLWLANLMAAGHDPEAEAGALIAALDDRRAPTVLVSNEVGLGIVPDNALARAFRDAAGRLNQRIAARAERVIFIAAGLPLVLKETS